MAVTWKNVFENYGIKKVSKTDKAKKAYVPNQGQRAAIEAAGVKPANTRPAPEFDLTVLSDPKIGTIKSSYYYAERSAEADRSPEPRMGHEIISSWLDQDDTVIIGNIGAQIFAIKLQCAPDDDAQAINEVVRRSEDSVIIARAKKAKGKPARRIVQRNDFVRDPYVVAAALIRAGGKCEMPGCSRNLFHKDDSTPYLEVHHVTPLAENGDDTLANAAALCPHCHRELHLGKNRKSMRRSLSDYVASI